MRATVKEGMRMVIIPTVIRLRFLALELEPNDRDAAAACVLAAYVTLMIAGIEKVDALAELHAALDDIADMLEPPA